MQARFRYTRPETMEYNEYFLDFHNANVFQRNRYGLYWWILLAISILICAIVSFYTSWILALTVFASMLVLVGPPLLFQVREHFEGDTDEKIMSFSEWGREMFYKETRISTHWQHYDRVEERDLLFFLHFGNQIEAIPKRLFDETELGTFRQWITGIDGTPATGQAKLYAELLSQGPPDFLFDFEHQDLLDLTSEPLEPVAVTPANEMPRGNARNPLGVYAWLVALLVLLLGMVINSFYFKMNQLELIACFLGPPLWIYGVNFLSTKFQIHPPEEEIAKQFPFKDKTVFIKPEGLGAGLPGAFGFYRWRDVAGIWENSHCIQIGVFGDSHVIPKRLFESETEAKKFLRRLVPIREKGKSQLENDTVNTGNPYQTPVATLQRSSDQPEFLTPGLSRYMIALGILVTFASGLGMIGFSIFLISEFARSVGQPDSRYSIAVLAGSLIIAALMIVFGGLIVFSSFKGITVWRHRNDRYRMDETTFWLNDQAFSLNELRIRTNKQSQIAYIINGDKILSAFTFTCPAYKKIVPLIPNEKTDA